MRKKERERILILCSHADDEIISMGGTIAKYVKERKDIRIVIFTSGEKSMPWMKEGVITKKRVKESEAAGKLLGCKVEFLGLPDLKIKENLEGNAKKIKEILKEFKPHKIFTHTRYDAHPDHRAVFYSLERALEGRERKPKVFTFMIWGLFNPKDSATFYVKTDETFGSKIKALQAFKTQKLIVTLFYLPIFIRDRIGGIRNKCKYAETFYVENA